MEPTFHGTTILSVRRDGIVALGGDGQVTLGNIIVKATARKVRKLHHERVLAGFAGATADAFTLFERFEAKLEKHQGHLLRAAVELTKDWRTDRVLLRLEAMLAVADREARRRELEKSRRSAPDVNVSADDAVDVDGVRVLVAQAQFEDPKAMPDAADKLRGRLGDQSVVVLGSATGGRVALLVSATPGAVERGIKAGAIVKAAAQVVGGGGGGRDTMAQAGGRDPERLPDAVAAGAGADSGPRRCPGG